MVFQGHVATEVVESRVKSMSTPIPKPSLCLGHLSAQDGRSTQEQRGGKAQGPRKEKAKEQTEIRDYLKETITNSWGWKEKVSLRRKLKIDREKKRMSKNSKHLKIRSKISQEMLQKEIRVKDGNKREFGEENIRCREFIFYDFMESSL